MPGMQEIVSIKRVVEVTSIMDAPLPGIPGAFPRAIMCSANTDGDVLATIELVPAQGPAVTLPFAPGMWHAISFRQVNSSGTDALTVFAGY